MKLMKWVVAVSVAMAGVGFGRGAWGAEGNSGGEILTPKAGPEPRINGAMVFGVRPGHPVVYTVAATGDRPMTFTAEGLPAGVKLDEKTGMISGSTQEAGTHEIVLHAKNSAGEAKRTLKLVVGETIALTPPMGWNHYNAFGTHISQKVVSAQAHAMVDSGLINHGWVYINIDDGWQGERGGKFNAIQPDAALFPDMQGLSDEVHALGLRFGLYSTPWIESYGHRIGGSADNPEGKWARNTEDPRPARNKKVKPYAIGTYTFYEQDAKQYAAWGVDYLKYDWNPIEIPETKAEYEILRNCGRDIVLSLSNSAPFSAPNGGVKDWMKWSNAWRTGGDIRDLWEGRGVKSRIFTQDKWAPYAGPGHWNDPDMMVRGGVGFGGQHRTKLTPDEQYSHMSAWCLMSVPLLLGCDMTKLDPFTLGLLTNDEVIAVNQYPLGKQATVVASTKKGNDIETGVLAKEMADGSRAVGLFNTRKEAGPVTVTWKELGISGKQVVRDLWREKDLGEYEGEFTATVPGHGVVMVRVGGGK
ncbi:MAG: putative Ig domain-containing protein [Phycisphaerae bacterium]